MVDVRFEGKSLRFTGVHIHGHATGSETVCAIVSALGMALVGALKNVELIYGKRAIEFLQFQYEDGIDIVLNDYPKPLYHTVNAMFTTIYIGLKQVEQSSPEYVRVIEPP